MSAQTIFGNATISGNVSVGFSAGKNGAVCDDVTDDTAAFNTVLAALYNAGGGTVYVAGTCLIAGAVVLPNDGGTYPNLSQHPIRIAGINSTANGLWTGLGGNRSAPSALDMRYNASVAKIDTRAVGRLEIDHIALIDSGSDCAPFVQTINTTIHIHEVAFSGTAAGASACNDAIVMGGTADSYGGDSTSYFQGYGSIIENNWFDQIQRAVFARNDTNGIQIVNNTVTANSGGASHAALEFWSGAVKWNMGNYIAGNLLELKYYAYGIWFSAGHGYGNVMVGNGMWDPTNGVTSHAYQFATGSIGNYIIDGHDEVISPYGGPSTGNTYITSNNSAASVPNTGVSIIGNPSYSTAYSGDLVTTVSALPSCGTSSWTSTRVKAGGRATVTDAVAPTYLGTLTGGGSVFTPVVCNGTDWVSY